MLLAVLLVLLLLTPAAVLLSVLGIRPESVLHGLLLGKWRFNTLQHATARW
jgi:hypothetical protein